MNWNDIVEKVTPSVVKIETPDGFGTGFLCLYNENRFFTGIATACHVVEHADKWQQPIRIHNFHSKTTALLQEADRIILLDSARDSAVILVQKGANLKFPEEPIPLLPTET